MGQLQGGTLRDRDDRRERKQKEEDNQLLTTKVEWESICPSMEGGGSGDGSIISKSPKT